MKLYKIVERQGFMNRVKWTYHWPWTALVRLTKECAQRNWPQDRLYRLEKRVGKPNRLWIHDEIRPEFDKIALELAKKFEIQQTDMFDKKKNDT